MIPIQILRVLSTIRQYDVPALLMGGQACVLYGAAEYSRDLDLAVLATNDALPRVTAAMQALRATVIEVPPFELQFLSRGHVVHFSVPDETETTVATPLRVDIQRRPSSACACGNDPGCARMTVRFDSCTGMYAGVQRAPSDRCFAPAGAVAPTGSESVPDACGTMSRSGAREPGRG